MRKSLLKLKEFKLTRTGSPTTYIATMSSIESYFTDYKYALERPEVVGIK